MLVAMRNRSMGAIAAVAALAPASTALAVAAPGSKLSAGAGITCTEAGRGVVTFAGERMLGDRQGTVVFNGIAGPCRSSDPSITSATVTGSAPVTLHCGDGFRATDAGTYTIAWNNGNRSVVAYREHSRIGVGHSEGTVLRGEFAGMHIQLHDLEGADPSICLRAQGEVTGFYLGMFRIGSEADRASTGERSARGA
jgi:hypothetical protein